MCIRDSSTYFIQVKQGTLVFNGGDYKIDFNSTAKGLIQIQSGATAIIESGNFEGNEEIINNAGNAVLNGSGHYCTSNTTANTYVVYTSGGSTLTINDGYFYSEANHVTVSYTHLTGWARLRAMTRLPSAPSTSVNTCLLYTSVFSRCRMQSCTRQ